MMSDEYGINPHFDFIIDLRNFDKLIIYLKIPNYMSSNAAC